MSLENVELVRRTYEAYGSPRMNAVAEADWHPDVEWQAAEGIGVLRGRPAVLGYFADWFESFEDLCLRLDETIDADDQVVAVQRLSGRGRTSGAPLDAHLAVVFTVREGKIVRACEYATRAEALEAVRLAEEAMSRGNREVVRSLFEAFVTDGLDAAAKRYLDDDAEYVEDPVWPGASSYRGRGEVVACFEGYMEALGGEGAWTLTVEKVVDGGEHQAALVRLASQGSASGLPHEHLWGYAAKVREGRVVHLRAYYDLAEALEAVGLLQ